MEVEGIALLNTETAMPYPNSQPTLTDFSQKRTLKYAGVAIAPPAPRQTPTGGWLFETHTSLKERRLLSVCFFRLFYFLNARCFTMPLALRLDAGPDAESTTCRLSAFKYMLRDSYVAHFLVEERKESGQVHWQAILYTDAPQQRFRDVFRVRLGCRKTEYSVVNAPKPLGFETYLCKGPTSTRGVLPIVLQSVGVKYTPTFFESQHHQWYINGESMKTRRNPATPTQNLLQICEDKLRARQTPVNLRSCVWMVWTIVQNQRKMMSRHQIVWTASQLYCIFDSSANINMFNNCYMDAAQEFSETNVGALIESPYYVELPDALP